MTNRPSFSSPSKVMSLLSPLFAQFSPFSNSLVVIKLDEGLFSAAGSIEWPRPPFPSENASPLNFPPLVIRFALQSLLRALRSFFPLLGPFICYFHMRDKVFPVPCLFSYRQSHSPRAQSPPLCDLLSVPEEPHTCLFYPHRLPPSLYLLTRFFSRNSPLFLSP